MICRVETTNAISNATLGTVCEAGAIALAAALLKSPIGAVGGAIFGATRYVSVQILRKVASGVFNTENPAASAAAKAIALAISFFGSYGAAWGLLAAMGLTLTLSHVAVLVLTSLITVVALAFMMGCTGSMAAQLARGGRPDPAYV